MATARTTANQQRGNAANASQGDEAVVAAASGKDALYRIIIRVAAAATLLLIAAYIGYGIFRATESRSSHPQVKARMKEAPETEEDKAEREREEARADLDRAREEARIYRQIVEATRQADKYQRKVWKHTLVNIQENNQRMALKEREAEEEAAKEERRNKAAAEAAARKAAEESRQAAQASSNYRPPTESARKYIRSF